MKLKKLYNGLFDVYKPSVKISKLVDEIGQTKIPTMSDAEGLKRAYDLPNKVYVNNHKMYVAGTSNLQDVWDDLKIPFHLTAYAERYKQAEDVLKDNPQVDSIIGHSLGGAVTLELDKNHNYKYDTTTYGSPTFELDGRVKGKRYRHPNDPVSELDKGAIVVPLPPDIDKILGPPTGSIIDQIKRNHSYQGYGNQGDDPEGNIGHSFSYSKK